MLTLPLWLFVGAAPPLAMKLTVPHVLRLALVLLGVLALVYVTRLEGTFEREAAPASIETSEASPVERTALREGVIRAE